MKKCSSFFAGMIVALLILAMGTTAMAASGQVTFNFSNVALNGETKIAAGSTITAANGQQIPSSILYTDAAGGKTNYVPIRTICDLLGVKIGYDSTSKTVILGEQSGTQTTTSDLKWQREINGRDVSYVCGEEGHSYDTPPAFRPTWTADGWSLVKMSHDTRNYTADWEYQGTAGKLSFRCGYPSTAGFGRIMNSEDSVKNCQELTIQGREADYYQDGTVSLLVWENPDGVLFYLSGTNVSQELITEVAESVKLCASAVAEHTMDWLPKGYSLMDRYAIADTVQEYWVSENVALSWIYSATPLGQPAEIGSETDIDGVEGRFWAAEEPYSGSAGTTTVNGNSEESINGVTTITIPAQKNMNTLVWQDPDSGVYYRLQSILSRDTMLRIAESVK